jgi:hypothetical protein
MDHLRGEILNPKLGARPERWKFEGQLRFSPLTRPPFLKPVGKIDLAFFLHLLLGIVSAP